MPYKYIGRTTWFYGKTLWEIVGNLKNYGVGRFVTRNIYARYPEPSYFKILKVETLPCPVVQDLDNFRRVRVVVQSTFRGVTEPEPVVIEAISYKPDYRLIPKDEEEAFCKKGIALEHNKVFPKTIELPPLLKEVIIREDRAKGEVTKDFMMDIAFKDHSYYKIAERNEDATEVFHLNMKELPKISLYKDVKT